MSLSTIAPFGMRAEVVIAVLTCFAAVSCTACAYRLTPAMIHRLELKCCVKENSTRKTFRIGHDEPVTYFYHAICKRRDCCVP
jgi:hypothetical protein